MDLDNQNKEKKNWHASLAYFSTKVLNRKMSVALAASTCSFFCFILLTFPYQLSDTLSSNSKLFCSALMFCLLLVVKQIVGNAWKRKVSLIINFVVKCDYEIFSNYVCNQEIILPYKQANSLLVSKFYISRRSLQNIYQSIESVNHTYITSHLYKFYCHITTRAGPNPKPLRLGF